MKVVLFCGGYGMRMRDDKTSELPKPMAMIGNRPLLWNVMRYYAHFGHTDFILCLGYGATHVKNYFLRYRETESNDFVLHGDTGRVELLRSDISNWKITFIQTGLETPIGERLRRVRPLLDGEEMFLANYADVLTDLPLQKMVERFTASDATASLLAVPPQAAFHLVNTDEDDRVKHITSLSTFPARENGGYFIFRPEIFDVLGENADLVADTLTTLAEQRRLLAYPYDGFWMPADTVKERAQLESMHERGVRPWALWDQDRQRSSAFWDGVERRHDRQRRRSVPEPRERLPGTR